MKRIVWSASLFLAVWLSGAATLHGADLQADCVKLDVVAQTTAQTPGLYQLDVTYTNMCSKDVTAVGAHYRSGSGTGWSTVEDWLPVLALPEKDRQGDILRAGAAIHSVVARQGDDDPGVPISASATYVIFADRSAVGDPTGIAGLVASRHRMIAEIQEALQILPEVSDYKAAAVFFGRTHSDLRSTGAHYLGSFAQMYRTSTPASWSNYLEREKALMQAQSSLFTEHSEIGVPGKTN
jgi:hypothetical protein